MVASLYELSLDACTILYKRGLITIERLPTDIKAVINECCFDEYSYNLLVEKDAKVLCSLGFGDDVGIYGKRFWVKKPRVEPPDVLSIRNFDHNGHVYLPDSYYPFLRVHRRYPGGDGEMYIFPGYMYSYDPKDSSLIRICRANYYSDEFRNYHFTGLHIDFALNNNAFRSLSANIIYTVLPIEKTTRLFYRET